MNWNSIETAPKDGEYILVFRATLPPMVVKWSKQRNCWLGADTMSEALSTPTHWMPLPAQPIAA